MIQQIGLFPHRTIAQNIATVPALLGWDRDRVERAGPGAARADLAPRRRRRPLPGSTLGRPAAARRGRARAGCRPARDADGRAVRRDRSDQSRAAAERVPPAAGGDPQDDPLRHPRHRRGDQDGRSHRRHARGRPPRAVRDPGRAPDGSRRRVRRGLRRRRPRPQAARPDARLRRRPLGGAARVRRAGHRARSGRSSTEPRFRGRCSSTPTGDRSAGSPTRDLASATVPSRPGHLRTRSSTATTSCATPSPTSCSRGPTTRRSSTAAAQSPEFSRST